MTEAIQPDTLIDDLLASESLPSSDIPQFDASSAFTKDEKSRLMQIAQDELRLDSNASFNPDPIKPLQVYNLLAIAPEVTSLLTLHPYFLSKISDHTFNDPHLSTSDPDIPEWAYLCRIIKPEKLLEIHNIDTNFTEHALRDAINANNIDHIFRFSSVLKRLTELAIFLPEKAKTYATEDVWQKVKAGIEDDFAGMSDAAREVSIVYRLTKWIYWIQLGFPGRMRELSFFQDWYQTFMQKYDQDKQASSSDSLAEAATDAYNLALLTSDGLEVTEDGQLRIIPHQSANPHSIPEPPQEYV